MQMRNFYIKLFYILLLSLFTPLFVHAFQFTNDLKVGNTNTDVLELQKILNSDAVTSVSPSGSGSKSNETTYFGNLTKQAVVRFQEKYRNEILVPAGLVSGTGYVGPSTRLKLNNISVKSIFGSATASKEAVQNKITTNTSTAVNTNSFNEINPTEINTTSNYFGNSAGQLSKQSLSSLGSTLGKDVLDLFPSFAKEVRLYKVDSYQVQPGQRVIINGTGFTKNNNIFSFGGVRTNGVDCSYSTYCEVSIPAGVFFGEIDISVENSNGNSSKEGFPAKVFVTNNPIKPPFIASTDPKQINGSNIGVSITIKGERFATEQNYIYTPLGSVGPYGSSDGKTIIFSLKDMKNLGKLAEKAALLKVVNTPLPIVVTNQYGQSDVFLMSLITNKK